ncbi:TlpA family protein disulfide reductase [Cellulophaga sp. HaHaR_3_176]|uniref:TlpA family protein disulfide reductase n=1 Tax=Cellulophaga sp. HaHaR_3_176 TaxID=1942464 RepID=UPI001C1FC586|nr:TlpA disulfide reductase family protein [Cellulophaga sp. HaHaR_3_176]QWX83931.1 TlpA family protein disulfide reductase [Cellulophaga sp. HaHaR_3_176]
MKHILLLFITLLTINLSAQHTISGTFSPAEDYTWLIAYRIKPGSQVYVADTKIDKGKFTLNLPADALPGSYRLVYAVPQEEYNFDVLYNGKEDIVFNFNSDQGASFVTSTENIILTEHLYKLSLLEKEIIGFYQKGSSNSSAFLKITEKMKNLQKEYEIKSEGLLAHSFITSNQPYIPNKVESVEEYVLHKKENYFNTTDFKDATLISSSYLRDKVANYVFTALPLETLSKENTQKEIIKNAKKIAYYLNGTDANFRYDVYKNLWDYAVAYNYNSVSDFIFENTLKDLATETNNTEAKKEMEAYARLRLGVLAPELTWKNGSDLKKLSTLKDATNYVLIFWSSTCGHCLKELPALHKELKNNAAIKIIAVGLEDDTVNWKLETKKLEGFEHAISLGKWDSEYADLYDIHSTPTYYILDKDKRIIAKPEDDKAVVEFLEKIY